MLKTLVLGLGNLLLGDEGVGVHAAQALQENCPPNTEILDIGTAILDALPALEKADRVILIDAMKARKEPGNIYRIPLNQCVRRQAIASLHGFDLFRVLALAGRHELPNVIVFGIEPAKIHWSIELSSQVENAMPYLLEAVRKEIRESTGVGKNTLESLDGRMICLE